MRDMQKRLMAAAAAARAHPGAHAAAAGGANVKFMANITNDRGNAMTLSNQATVREVGGPKVELQ